MSLRILLREVVFSYKLILLEEFKYCIYQLILGIQIPIKNIEIYNHYMWSNFYYVFLLKKSIRNTRFGEQKREISKIILLPFIT